MTTKLAKSGIISKINLNSIAKSKLNIASNENKLAKKNVEQEAYIRKKVAELRLSGMWKKMYFTDYDNYIKILDYEDANKGGRKDRFNKNLAHIDIYKLQKQTIENIKESFRQIEQINLHLHKKYKQDLLDSSELQQMLLNLADYQSMGSSLEKIDKTKFGSLLTSIGLKIMLDTLPDELQDLLLTSINDFNKINHVVTKLSGKKMPIISLEKNKQNKVIDIVIS